MKTTGFLQATASLLTGVVLAVCLVLTAAGCGGSSQQETVITVQKGPFEIAIPAFGELQAVKSTPVMVPPQTRGRQTIAWMAPENAFVKAGETVVRLDSSWYKERIQREEYAMAKLNLDLGKMEGELGKQKNDLQGELKVTGIEKEMAEVYGAKDETIFSRNQIIEDAISLEYLETKTEHYQRKTSQLEKKSRAELQLLQLRKKTAQVKLKQYKDALKSLEITAPHDGLFIYEKNWRGEKKRVGEAIWGGAKIGKLPDLERMEAKIYVLESEAAGLKADLPVSLEPDAAPGMNFTGQVTTIDTIAKPLERESPLKYFELKVSLDTTDTAVMKPGSQVKAVIYVAKQEDVVAVPNQSIFFENEQAFVNVKTGGGVEKRPVETGVRSLTRTVITGGLSEGETIFLGDPGPEDE